MKIVDESILFFSRVSLSKILSRSFLHFVGIKVFIIGCIRNTKGQFSSNKALWRLELATEMRLEFELLANCLARLEVLSCSAIVGVTLQLSYMLHTCATFGDSPIVRSSREALFKCTLLSFSLHFLTHYPYIIPS